MIHQPGESEVTSAPPGRHVHRAASIAATIKGSLAVGAIIFAMLAITTIGQFQQEISSVLLSCAWVTASVVSICALYQATIAKSVSTLTWVLVSLIINALFAGYLIVYDGMMSPHTQLVWTIPLLGIFLLETGLAILVFLDWQKYPHNAATGRSLVALIPILGLFGAWNTYVYEPQTSRPLITMMAMLSNGGPQATPAGMGDHVSVLGSIVLENKGTIDAWIVASMYKVTAAANPSDATPSSVRTASARADEIATSIDASGVLEPFGPNLHRLAGYWPSAIPGTSLLQLDEIVPAYFYLAAGETFSVSFTVSVPKIAGVEYFNLALHGQVIAMNSLDPELRECDAGHPPVYGDALELQENSLAGGGHFACVEASIRARTPIGYFLGDRPGLRAYYEVGNVDAPGSETVSLGLGFSVGGVVVDPLEDGQSGIEEIDRSAPANEARTTAELEVSFVD